MLKTVSSITNAIGALNFQGTWDASANTPTLASGVGTKGNYFVVGTAGTTTLDGISNWGVGDWATYNGSVWQRVEGGADLNGVNASLSGNLAFTGTGNRITGDFTNGTLANRVMFQTSTGNSNTNIYALPNGTGAASGWVAANAADPTNASWIRILTNSVSYTTVESGRSGTGTFLPMTLQTGGSERMRLDTAGIVTMSAYGAGAATFSAAGVISSVSDETWKIKDGVPVDADSMLKKLKPGYWYYNDEKKEIFGTARELGFYAQNVNEAIGPEAAPEPQEIINTDENGVITRTGKFRPWGYHDRSVLAVTVLSLQKALETIDTLTARIETLEAKILG